MAHTFYGQTLYKDRESRVVYTALEQAVARADGWSEAPPSSTPAPARPDLPKTQKPKGRR